MSDLTDICVRINHDQAGNKALWPSVAEQPDQAFPHSSKKRTNLGFNLIFSTILNTRSLAFL